MDIQTALIEEIGRANRAGAKELLEAWGREHGYENMLSQVLEPLLKMIGEQWCKAESYSIAQAYVAAKVAEDILLTIATRKGSTPGIAPRKGPVVIGNIEEDFHALGRRMIGTFLRSEGWDVIDLGNDVSPQTFVDTAVERKARIIGVSAMMLSTAQNIRRLREEIDRRGLTGQIQLAVGGAIFLVTPGLADTIGGDGTAGNALAVNALFDRLWEASLQSRAAE